MPTSKFLMPDDEEVELKLPSMKSQKPKEEIKVISSELS